MSQVSLPMRIALAATLAFCALWFVALRPKPAPTAPAPTPPAAQSTENAAKPNADATAPASRAKPATEGAKKPGAAIDLEKAAGKDTSKAARAVLRDISGGKVAVLLFWDRRLSDDRAVHTAVKGLSRRGGKVAVHVAPVAKLAKYERITRGVPVLTSPTVLIIDRAGHARSVAGLTVPSELEELVGKALKVKP